MAKNKVGTLRLLKYFRREMFSVQDTTNIEQIDVYSELRLIRPH